MQENQIWSERSYSARWDATAQPRQTDFEIADTAPLRGDYLLPQACPLHGDSLSRVLLFDLEEPHCCSHRTEIPIKDKQIKTLRHSTLSQVQRSIFSADTSKKRLLEEFEKIKRQYQ
jgi:hypothetical protein